MPQETLPLDEEGPESHGPLNVGDIIRSKSKEVKGFRKRKNE
jgi:hypothetical protein